MSITSLDLPRVRDRVTFATVGPSRTDTSQAESCEINGIVARFTRTGVLPAGYSHGQFADVTGLAGDRAEFVNRAQATISQTRQGVAATKAARDVAAAAEANELEATRKRRRRERQVETELDKEGKS